MPTDEQRMREQFEKWIEEKQYGLGWQDGRGTWEEFLSAARAGYRAAWQARDSEVQALREENEQYYDLLLIVDLANDMPGWVNPNLSERIKAVLAGEEATNE